MNDTSMELRLSSMTRQQTMLFNMMLRLAGVDSRFAIIFWQEFSKTTSLELAINTSDTKSMKRLDMSPMESHLFNELQASQNKLDAAIKEDIWRIKDCLPTLHPGLTFELPENLKP